MKNWIYIIMIGLMGSLVSSCQQALDDEVQTPQDSPRAANISMRLVLDEPLPLPVLPGVRMKTRAKNGEILSKMKSI